MTTLLFICVLIIFAIMYHKLQARIDNLFRETNWLRVELLRLKDANTDNVIKQESSQPPEFASELAKVKIEPNLILETAAQKQQGEVKVNAEPQLKTKKTFRDLEIWKNLETQFAENATGIIGTLAIVLGVVFLGVYAAIQLTPLGRFGIVCAFAFAFYAISVFLGKKSFWRNISLWLKSSAGVIFLIGCLGSVGIESMRWVQDPLLGLCLLCLGLAVNLVLGFMSKGQIFASIHVVFSLVALSIVPINLTTFIIAAIVSFVG